MVNEHRELAKKIAQKKRQVTEVQDRQKQGVKKQLISDLGVKQHDRDVHYIKASRGPIWHKIVGGIALAAVAFMVMARITTNTIQAFYQAPTASQLAVTVLEDDQLSRDAEVYVKLLLKDYLAEGSQGLKSRWARGIPPFLKDNGEKRLSSTSLVDQYQIDKVKVDQRVACYMVNCSAPGRDPLTFRLSLINQQFQLVGID